MEILKRRKELIPIIAIALLLSLAAFDLFSDQQDNSELLSSGKTIDPVTVSGRTVCEVPIPDVTERETETKLSKQVKEITE